MSRTVLITFLGIKPQLTKYRFQDQVKEGEVFAKALHELISFDQMLVCTTQQAYDKTWQHIEALGDERITKIDIPDGRDTEEMWQIFERILPHVQEKDEVIFDITHGLRSLPFLVFLFAAYLQFARQVKIKAIYYGALELKTDEGVAPVIDLSNFVTMLDWLVATDQFIQTGNAQRLANLINRKNKGVSKISQKLAEISQAALWCQPFKFMKSAGTINNINLGGDRFEQTASPFTILQERIISTYTQFAGNPHNLNDLIKKEYQMIFWYFEKDQIIQAITLAREWLIDTITWQLGYQVSLERSARERVERGISGVARIGRPDQSEEQLNEVGQQLINWQEKDKLVELWNTISDVRNKFAHAEHQKEQIRLNTIKRKINKIKKELQDLGIHWELV